jgi:hypothetical protein
VGGLQVTERHAASLERSSPNARDKLQQVATAYNLGRGCEGDW